jgi:hypothetical protein
MNSAFVLFDSFDRLRTEMRRPVFITGRQTEEVLFLVSCFVSSGLSQFGGSERVRGHSARRETTQICLSR